MVFLDKDGLRYFWQKIKPKIEEASKTGGVEVGTIVGWTGEGVPEGYDVKKIGYSTEEQIIGTWTNGKNHYRKVISFTPVGTIPANSWTTLFEYTFTDLELLTRATVINTDSANSGEIKWLTVQYFKTDNAFKGLHTRNSIVSLPANSLLVVEYTKTTDTGNFKYIEKKSVTPIDPITGSIVDTTNIDDKVHNTYSANVIDGLIDEKANEKITSFHNTKKIFMGCDYLGQKKSDFNLNNLNPGECCFYFANNDANNFPVNYPGGKIGCNYMIYCFQNISNYGSVQIAFPDGSAENTYLYIRYRWGSAWTGWLKISLTA